MHLLSFMVPLSNRCNMSCRSVWDYMYGIYKLEPRREFLNPIQIGREYCILLLLLLYIIIILYITYRPSKQLVRFEKSWMSIKQHGCVQNLTNHSKANLIDGHLDWGV